MKKTLSLILAVMMLLGCMSVTAFAEDNGTNITANVPKMSYTAIIPADTTLSETSHTGVLLGGDNGKASITVDKHGSAKENVYYTVDLTNANLADADGNTITTSYTYAQGGDYSALTADTKVTVYTGGKVVDSTIKVTADDTEWMAAPSGEYTASVVFNFVKEDAAPVISSVEDLIPENFPFNGDPRYWPNNAWKNENNRACFSYTSMGNPWLVFSDYNGTGDMDLQIKLICSTPVTKTSNGVYTATQNNITFVFTLTDSVLTSIQLSGSTSHDGTYTAPQR